MNAEERKHAEEEKKLAEVFRRGEEDRKRRIRRTLFLLLLLALLTGVITVLYPKVVGGPLCGPVCPQWGLRSWERNCAGINMRETIVDSYTDRCFGIPYGEPRCFGVSENTRKAEPMACPAWVQNLPLGVTE